MESKVKQIQITTNPDEKQREEEEEKKYEFQDDEQEDDEQEDDEHEDDEQEDDEQEDNEQEDDEQRDDVEPITPIKWTNDEICLRKKARVGLVNCGNTCQMNSAIQCLAHIPIFAVQFATRQQLPLTEETEEIKPHRELLHQWQDIMDVLWTKEEGVSGVRPGGFLGKFRECAVKDGMEWMAGFEQNDSHEFMMFLIECLHKAIKRPSENIIKMAELEIPNVDNVMSLTEQSRKRHTVSLCMKNWGIHFKDGVSIVTDQFQGQQINVIYSEETNEKSITFEPFACINIPVPKTDPGNLSLSDCFEETFSTEKLEGDEAWNSPTQNKKVTASKSSLIWKTPTVMIVSLKRFTFTGEKLDAKIDFDVENFDVEKFCAGPSKSDSKQNLVGLVLHFGRGLGFGHYISVVRHPGGEWWVWDDQRGKRIENVKDINPSNIQMLIYQKKRYCTGDFW